LASADVQWGFEIPKERMLTIVKILQKEKESSEDEVDNILTMILDIGNRESISSLCCMTCHSISSPLG